MKDAKKKNDKGNKAKKSKSEEIDKSFDETADVLQDTKGSVDIEHSTSDADAFKDVSSITSDISKLLIDKGFKSIEDLKNSSVKELTKIKGIDKKTAKNILKEIKK